MQRMLQERVSSQATLRGMCLRLIWTPSRDYKMGGNTAKGVVFSSVPFFVFLEKPAEQAEVFYADSGVVQADCVEL